MQLRNIINTGYPTPAPEGPSHKIVHQLNNEGCRCNLCQKIVIKENGVIPTYNFIDEESEHTKGKKEDFLLPFIMDYYFVDKMQRKVRFLLPEICVFAKGAPTTLITKKKDHAPIRIIKNKEKLNAFEIQNFFTEGYLCHNSQFENREDSKPKGASKDHYYNYRDVLKNECVLLAKFANGTSQMMNLTELSNLSKSKQRAVRNEITQLTTLVNADNHQELRVHIDIDPNVKNPLFERAKTEAKIVNEDIKPKDFMFISEKDEKAFEETLRTQNTKIYLEYLSMKLILLFSIKTDVFLESVLFKYIPGEGNSYYLSDIQVYSKTGAKKIWGDIRHLQAKQEQSPSPTKRKRPTSSPQKLQSVPEIVLTECDNEEKGATYKIKKESEKVRSMIGARPRTSTMLNLQPVTDRK